MVIGSENICDRSECGNVVVFIFMIRVKKKVKYSDAPTNEKVRSFFRSMYKIVDAEAKRFCHQLRIPESVKKTTVAPTGSVGNLAGCTTGCQSTFSKLYIRRMRLSNSDPLLEDLKKRGYNIVPDIYAANTSVVEYICYDPIYEQAIQMYKEEFLKEGDHEAKAIGRAIEAAAELVEDQEDLSIEDVLATQRMLQTEFVDNSISITVNVDREKYSKSELKSTLRHFLGDLKGLTIFPETSMPLSPLQRITLEELREFEMKGYPIEKSQAEMTCGPMGCPIK
jgi:ribonucleoside-triphosphate reductase